MTDALLPLSTRTVSLRNGQHLVINEVNYLAASNTVDVDMQVQRGANGTEAGVFHLDGGTAPDAAVGVPGATAANVVRVTLGGSTVGTTGRILLVLRATGNTSL